MKRKLFLAAACGFALLAGALSVTPGPVFAYDGPEAPTPEPAVVPPPFCKIDMPQKKEAPGKDKPAGAADQAKPAEDATAKAEPAPPAKTVLLPEMTATCADGKIKFGISARIYGWEIGHVIPLTITFSVPEGAVINTDTIKQGKLAIADEFKQPFELTGKPLIKSVKKDGVTEYEITIEVRQFEIKALPSFSMQLPYAVEFAPDQSPKWQIFTTPAYLLLNGIDGGYEGLDRPMTMGNTDGAKPRTPWAVPVLTIVIVLLLLTWPAMSTVRYVNRVRPRQTISRDAAAWLALHSVLKSGKEIGFGSTHYSRIDEVLRKYLGAVYTGLEGMTMTEVEALPDTPQAKIAKSVFRKLDSVLVHQRTLSAAEQAQLLREVDQLVARPYSM